MKKRIGYFCVSFIIISLSISLIFTLTNTASSDDESSDHYLYARIFEKTINIVRNNYVNIKKIKPKGLYFGAIEGMLKSLSDEHTTFLSPKIWKELHESLSGRFEGLGIHIGIRDNWLTVIAPIEGAPAYKAGLHPADVIFKIEGKSTKGITLEEAVTKLRGPRGTKVKITILRKGEPKPFDVTITRDVINVPSIRYGMMSSNIGYIRLIQFQRNIDVDIRKAIKKLHKKGMRKLVLDLRNNPGGYLIKAVNVVDLFISKGKIVSSRGRISSANEEYSAHSFNTVAKNIPLVVMINGASASASEIVAGAIQDTRRGVVVGTKSYGKGSVQSLFPLSTGTESFGVKITTALYYTPANRLIHKKGIKPDIELKEPKITIEQILARSIILKRKLIKKFVKRYRNRPSLAQIKAFHKKLVKMNLPISLRLLGQMVYREIHKTEMPKVFNLNWDIQLRQAMQIFRTKPHLFKRQIVAFN